MFTLLNTRRICYLRGSIFRTGAARRVPFSRAAGLVLRASTSRHSSRVPRILGLHQ